MQAFGLHDRTAKSAEEVAATARAPGAGVRTTATGERRGRLRTLPSRHSRSGASFCAANSVVFRARSASAGDDTRGFSLCLTFWYFWVKPKVQRKTIADFLSAQRLGSSFRSHLSPHKFSCSFFRRKSQRRPRGENDRESAAHLAERSRKTTLIARSFRALGVRRLLHPTFSHRGIMQAYGLPRNAMQAAKGCGARRRAGRSLRPRRPAKRRALRRLRPADANGSTPIRPTLLSESEPRIPPRDDDSRNSARKAETDLSGTAKSISNP